MSGLSKCAIKSSKYHVAIEIFVSSETWIKFIFIKLKTAIPTALHLDIPVLEILSFIQFSISFHKLNRQTCLKNIYLVNFKCILISDVCAGTGKKPVNITDSMTHSKGHVNSKEKKIKVN